MICTLISQTHSWRIPGVTGDNGETVRPMYETVQIGEFLFTLEEAIPSLYAIRSSVSFMAISDFDELPISCMPPVQKETQNSTVIILG